MRFTPELLQSLERECGLRFLFSYAVSEESKEVIVFDCIEADYVVVDAIRTKMMKLPETLFANVGFRGKNAYFVWVRRLSFYEDSSDTAD